MDDREVISTRCFICGANTKKKIPWFTMNEKHYYTVVTCERHGLLKGKIRMRKSIDDRVYVVKTMKQVSEETMQELISRKEQSRESRRDKRKKTK